ncbi:MAG: DUF4339 domain-containing protein [Thermoguttaceae bacterium]|nr:DUF4339 domain-containing protein [Thermoguttaceae bacterium]
MTWYYVVNQQQVGPVGDVEINEAIARGIITPATMVWRFGMSNWTNILDTELKSLFPSTPSFTLPPVMPGMYPPPPPPQAVPSKDTEIQTIEKYFLIFWICLAVGCCSMVFLIGIPILIAAQVFEFLLLYKFWILVSPPIARTTPGKAVGFCFIPFFNLYWCFVAFYGLSQDMNKTLEMCQSPVRTNESLVLAWCIVSVASLLSYLHPAAMLPFGVAGAVLEVLSLFEMKKGAIEIIKRRL